MSYGVGCAGKLSLEVNQRSWSKLIFPFFAISPFPLSWYEIRQFAVSLYLFFPRLNLLFSFD